MVVHSKSAGGLDIRTARASDDDALSRLFETTFGAKRPAGRWAWQFRSTPAAPGISVIGEAQGEVVAHAGVIVRKFILQGTEILAAQSVDAMTHPRWQRKGLQRLLTEHLYAALPPHGVSVLFGFTNEHSTPGALGYQQRRALRPFPLLARPLRLLSALRPLFQRPTDLPLPPAWMVPAELDALWSARAPSSEAGIWRDAAHQSWRWSKPGGRYWPIEVRSAGALEGFGVLALRRHAGLLCAFAAECIPGEGIAAARLADAMMSRARELGAHAFFALGFDGSTDRALWRRAGLAFVPERITPEYLVFSVRSFRQATPRALVTPQQWTLRWGEHDVI